MLQRFDVGTLGSAEKTPQGGLRVAAHLTRTGVFKYDDGKGGAIFEYRPADEVFKADSLATLADAPLTVGHPGLINPDNHAQNAAGHVRDVKQDGERVAGTVVIQGRKAIRAVEKGTRQVSCGYMCRVDETPGVAPDGTRYDRVQRDLRYNHVALVDVGRAGPDVRLRLDAAGNQSITEEKMEFERIDGVKYEVGTEAHAAAVKNHEKAEAARKQKFDELEASNKKLAADLEVAKADKTRLDGEIATLKDPARLDEAAKSRASLLDSAKKILGAEVKLDGLSDIEIKRQVAVKAYPDVKLDAKEVIRVEAFYEAALANAKGMSERRDEETRTVAEVRKAIVTSTDTRLDADAEWEKMRERELNRWKQKPATAAE